VLNGNLDAFIPDIESGRLSQRQAAKRLDVTASAISQAIARKTRAATVAV
jgi:predicted XRE-type DNA-binding protein